MAAITAPEVGGGAEGFDFHFRHLLDRAGRPQKGLAVRQWPEAAGAGGRPAAAVIVAEFPGARPRDRVSDRFGMGFGNVDFKFAVFLDVKNITAAAADFKPPLRNIFAICGAAALKNGGTGVY